jgi:hypothetical protein
MRRHCLTAILCVCAGLAHAETPVELEGATIMGNRELPKVLYIVPWRSAAPATPAGELPPALLDEVLAPVDREVFARRLEYYDAIHSAD